MGSVSLADDDGKKVADPSTTQGEPLKKREVAPNPLVSETSMPDQERGRGEKQTGGVQTGEYPKPTTAEAPAKTPAVFSKAELLKGLRQAEIVSMVVQHVYDPATDEVESRVHAFSIVVTQDCDLERDRDWRILSADERAVKPPPLNEILLLEAVPAESIRPQFPKSAQWHDLCLNNVERYAFIQACSPDDDLRGEGLPALVIDFRRCFAVRPDELYRQINFKTDARRRSRLISPYCEHFQNRLASYMSRVALPVEHRKS